MVQPMGGGPVAVKADNKQALWSLILGILGFVCCQIAAPFAWYLGRAEIKAVDAGLSAQENRGMALAGMILGIVGTVLLALGLLWLFLAGGLAIMGGVLGSLQ